MHKSVLHLFLLCLGCQSTGEVRPVPYRVPLADAARTQVLVLATPHLRELAECYRPAVLDRLRERLRRFKPDMIAIESLPPEAIVAFEQEDSDFAREVLEGFARSITEAARHAQQALGLSRAQAQRLLDQPTPDAGGERPETRVLRLIAAYQLDSAVLAWSGLSEEARLRSGVAQPLADLLEKRRTATNEVPALALPLALSLGLARLTPVDGFAGEAVYARHFDQFAADVARSPEVAAVSKAPLYQDSSRRLKAACADPEAMLAYYQWLNSPDYARRDAELQWGVWFRTHFASGLDRARYAGWEARNLEIATNIRKASSEVVGKRVLVIYGAAHKPFLDAYLSNLLDVKLVQLSDLDP